MGEKIDRIVWEELGHQMHVFYAHGRQDLVAASFDVAARYASSAGLSLVPATRERIEWVRIDSNPAVHDDLSISRRHRSWLRRLGRGSS